MVSVLFVWVFEASAFYHGQRARRCGRDYRRQRYAVGARRVLRLGCDRVRQCRAPPPSSSAAPSVPAAATFASDTKVTRYCPGASVTPVVPEAVMLCRWS